MWDPQGRLVAHGEFRSGKQHGKWAQLMPTFGFATETFQPPFTSQADFANGKLHGTWTVSDSRQRLVGSWEFDRGELHGKATRLHANGQPQEELMFKQGKLHGECNLFTTQGALVNREFFRNGKQLIPVLNWHEPNEQKQAEGWLQTSQVTVHTTLDWWNGLLDISREPPGDEPIRIGKWTEWHPNGNARFTGVFDVGESVGTHTWWHENGQKQLVGRYAEGLRVDRWTRWHANGHKQEEGEFIEGNKRGVWKVWAENGQLIDEQQVAYLPDAVETELVPVRTFSDRP
jgi:antitoxin component YwqK of YwqJK toxin-antitoxin module